MSCTRSVRPFGFISCFAWRVLCFFWGVLIYEKPKALLLSLIPSVSSCPPAWASQPFTGESEEYAVLPLWGFVEPLHRTQYPSALLEFLRGQFGFC